VSLSFFGKLTNNEKNFSPRRRKVRKMNGFRAKSHKNRIKSYKVKNSFFAQIKDVVADYFFGDIAVAGL
jgi:hypothetical protein